MGGGLSPKFTPNRWFSFKLPENCMILNSNLGGKGAGHQGHFFSNYELHEISFFPVFLPCADGKILEF